MDLFVALLRGINVGGKNLIKMADLAACFEAQGFSDVSTYIQSGNVIFRANGIERSLLASRIEEALSKTFDYSGNLVLRSREEIRNIIAGAPAEFGRAPDDYRYDVLFLKEPLTSAEVMGSISPKEGVDRAFPGNGVLYFSRLTSRASQSRLSRIITMPFYQNLTIRNWNTTRNLLDRMEPAA